jgi:hypothetical protein
MRIVEWALPPWFASSEILIQLVFAFVTLFIAYYSYKVYKLSSQQPSLLYGLGFLGVSVSYFVQAILNFFVLRGVQSDQIIQAVTAGAMDHVIPLSVVAVVLHMILMTASFGLLAYVTLKSRGVKPLLLIWSLSFAALLFADKFTIAFYLICAILLLYITAQYYQRLDKYRTLSSLQVFLGFGMILLGMAQIGLALTFNLLYITGHFVALVGYLLLLWSLFRVVEG